MKVMTIGAVLLGVALSGAAFADDHEMHEGMHEGEGRGMNLTAEQREQMRAIHEEYRERMQALREERHERIQAILTPEQRQQMAERMERMRERREHMHERRMERREERTERRRERRSGDDR